MKVGDPPRSNDPFTNNASLNHHPWHAAGGLCSQVAAQSPPKRGESLETLTTDANDPTAILAQLKIENDYAVDEYGT